MGKNVINTLYTIHKTPPIRVVIGYHDVGMRFEAFATLDNELGKMNHILFRQLYRRTAMMIAGATGLHIFVIEVNKNGDILRTIGECLNPYEHGDNDDDDDGDNNTTS